MDRFAPPILNLGQVAITYIKQGGVHAAPRYRCLQRTSSRNGARRPQNRTQSLLNVLLTFRILKHSCRIGMRGKATEPSLR